MPPSSHNPLCGERGDAARPEAAFRVQASIRSSLQARLVALWIALLASAAATAYLLFGLYTQSTAVQISQAEIAVGRACREIIDRYTVLSNEPQGAWRCSLRIDDGPPLPMEPDGPRTVMARIDWPAGARRLSVTVTDGTTNPRKNGAPHTDTDTIEPVGRTFEPAPVSERPGSDDCRLPLWPEKGLRGDQLGSNRVGRHW